MKNRFFQNIVFATTIDCLKVIEDLTFYGYPIHTYLFDYNMHNTNYKIYLYLKYKTFLAFPTYYFQHYPFYVPK